MGELRSSLRSLLPPPPPPNIPLSTKYLNPDVSAQAELGDVDAWGSAQNCSHDLGQITPYARGTIHASLDPDCVGERTARNDGRGGTAPSYYLRFSFRITRSFDIRIEPSHYRGSYIGLISGGSGSGAGIVTRLTKGVVTFEFWRAVSLGPPEDIEVALVLGRGTYPKSWDFRRRGTVDPVLPTPSPTVWVPTPSPTLAPTPVPTVPSNPTPTSTPRTIPTPEAPDDSRDGSGASDLNAECVFNLGNVSAHTHGTIRATLDPSCIGERLAWIDGRDATAYFLRFVFWLASDSNVQIKPSPYGDSYIGLISGESGSGEGIDTRLTKGVVTFEFWRAVSLGPPEDIEVALVLGRGTYLQSWDFRRRGTVDPVLPTPSPTVWVPTPTPTATPTPTPTPRDRNKDRDRPSISKFIIEYCKRARFSIGCEDDAIEEYEEEYLGELDPTPIPPRPPTPVPPVEDERDDLDPDLTIVTALNILRNPNSGSRGSELEAAEHTLIDGLLDIVREERNAETMRQLDEVLQTALKVAPPSYSWTTDFVYGALCGEACFDQLSDESDPGPVDTIAYSLGWQAGGIAPGINSLADLRDWTYLSGKCAVTTVAADSDCNKIDLALYSAAVIPYELCASGAGCVLGVTGAAADAGQAARIAQKTKLTQKLRNACGGACDRARRTIDGVLSWFPWTLQGKGRQLRSKLLSLDANSTVRFDEVRKVLKSVVPETNYKHLEEADRKRIAYVLDSLFELDYFKRKFGTSGLFQPGAKNAHAQSVVGKFISGDEAAGREFAMVLTLIKRDDRIEGFSEMIKLNPVELDAVHVELDAVGRDWVRELKYFTHNPDTIDKIVGQVKKQVDAIQNEKSKHVNKSHILELSGDSNSERKAAKDIASKLVGFSKVRWMDIDNDVAGLFALGGAR